MEEVLKGVYLLLCQNGYVKKENIFRSFQNQGVVSNKSFIVFQILGNTTKSTPTYKDDILQNKVSYDNISIVQIQVDFYGELALSAVSQINSYITSRAANDFFKKNKIRLSIYNAEQVLNLSGVLDNKNFEERYVLRFNLFANYKLNVEQDYFDINEFNENFNYYFVQNNKVINNNK